MGWGSEQHFVEQSFEAVNSLLQRILQSHRVFRGDRHFACVVCEELT